MILCVAALIAGAAFPLSAPVTAHARSLPVLTLTYGDREFVYSESADPPADFTVAEELARRGMDKPPRERMGIVDGMIARGVGTEEALTYCFPRLPEVLDAAGAAVALEPKDAEMRFYPDRTPMFEISRSSPGVRLDRERTCENVYFALRRGAGSAALAVETLSPERTAEDLSAYTHLRAAYETDFSSSTPERRHNVRLALTRVGGVMLDDGETFSFNETVGRRTRANGFESAKIIVGGRYTEGVGGGVCQASTAVYNCALRAGLKITAVSRHSLVPTYVPPSFDAMVNGSGSDRQRHGRASVHTHGGVRRPRARGDMVLAHDVHRGVSFGDAVRGRAPRRRGIHRHRPRLHRGHEFGRARARERGSRAREERGLADRPPLGRHPRGKAHTHGRVRRRPWAGGGRPLTISYSVFIDI